jgi:hypothetical protein
MRLILYIPSTSTFRPTVINRSWPIESIGSRLRDYTRTFDSSVHAQSASRRTLPAEWIEQLPSLIKLLKSPM